MVQNHLPYAGPLLWISEERVLQVVLKTSLHKYPGNDLLYTKMEWSKAQETLNFECHLHHELIV